MTQTDRANEIMDTLRAAINKHEGQNLAAFEASVDKILANNYLNKKRGGI